MLTLGWDEHTVVGRLEGVKECKGVGRAIQWAEKGIPAPWEGFSSDEDKFSGTVASEDDDSGEDNVAATDNHAATDDVGSKNNDRAMDDNWATDDDDAMSNNDNAVTDNDEAMDDDGTTDGDDAVTGDNTAKESGEAIDNDSASDVEVDRGVVHKASAPKQGVKHFIDSDEDDSAPSMSPKKKMCRINVLVEAFQRDSALQDILA